MFCPYCGQKNRGKPEYCERCGRSFAKLGRESDVVCSVCKKDSPADARYCWHCGERFEEDEKDNEDSKDQKQQDQNITAEAEIDQCMDRVTDKVEEISPADAEYKEIFFTFSHEEAEIVKSILDAGGIDYFCKGYYSQGILAEPVRFCVYKWDVEKAVELLKEMENEPPDGIESKEPK